VKPHLNSLHTAISFLQLVCPFVLVTTAQAADTPRVHSPEQVLQWVRDLNSDSFIQREVATAKLIEAGSESIEPLLVALSENNLEVTTRAIYVLRELSLSMDPRLEQAAREALVETAQPGGTSAARRARVALQRLDAVREERAVAELKQLGANIAERQSHAAFSGFEQYSIEIGETWRGKTADLRRLGRIKNIGELVLEGSQVTDECLKYIPTADAPAALTVKRASVTDAGVKQLVGMKGLEVLSLMYVPITDNSVTHLQQLAGVARMRIYGSRMTRAGADRLQAAISGTEIDFRLGAFLGIGCQPGDNGCVIYTVRANTAADKGGLQTNDLIYEYEGTKVTDFEQLTALIANNEAGDTVTIKIKRRGRELAKQITLGEWE
jgi:hypothetical protein